MKKYRLMLVAVSAFFCGVSATQAANWVPLDDVEVDDAPLVRTNHGDSEDGSNSAVICTSGPTNSKNTGINGGGRRIGFLTNKGKCKTVGAGQDVTQKTENIMVLLDDVMDNNYDPGTTGNEEPAYALGRPEGDVDNNHIEFGALADLASCLELNPVGDNMLEQVINCVNTLGPVIIDTPE